MPRIIASFFSYGYSYMLMSQYSNSFYDGLLLLYYTSQFCNLIVLYCTTLVGLWYLSPCFPERKFRDALRNSTVYWCGSMNSCLKTLQVK